MVDIYEWTNHTEAFPFSTFDSQCVQVVRHYLANNISLLEEDLREEPCWNSTFDLACLFENVGNATYLREDFKSCRNSTEDDFNPFYFYQTEQLIFLWVLLILIVVGNLAVLGALSMSNTRKSRMNYFIKHLAIADLSVGLISVLTDIVWKITVNWHAGNIACKVIRFSQVLVTYSSTYVLVALSIDRYDAICHPMNFSHGWRRARALVAVAWILSALFASPILVLYQEGVIQGQVQCWIDFPQQWQWKLYITLVSVILLVLPALLIFACYIVIVRTIWVQSSALMANVSSYSRPAASNRDGRVGALMLEEDQDSRRASSRGIIPRAKIKTVKMTFVIVFVFILCWAPYIVFDLLQVYGHIPKTKTMTAVATFIQSLAPLNSAANPLIYCLFSTHLCRNLRKIPAVGWLARQLQWLVGVVSCWSTHSGGLCCCCRPDVPAQQEPAIEKQPPALPAKKKKRKNKAESARPISHPFRHLAAKTAPDKSTRTTHLSLSCSNRPESERLVSPPTAGAVPTGAAAAGVSVSVAAAAAAAAAATPASFGSNGRRSHEARLEDTICEDFNVSTKSEWV